MRSFIHALTFLLLVGLFTATTANAGQADRTDINMVIALDRSESIDTTERDAQIDALIFVLTNDRFLTAAISGRHRKIGISVFGWSSFERTEQILPWMLIGGREDAEWAVRRLKWHQAHDSDVHHGPQTDIALAIATGVKMLKDAPFFGAKQVINVVSDGIDNFGRVALIDRNLALDQGIVINGLVQARNSAIEVVTRFFKRQVIGGPTSFVQATNTHQSFAQAMLRKMTVEIALLSGLAPDPGT
ncbi:MAG: DUF1194 domain-containing protein [Rhodospirillaceae bacterium]|nr:DUF1194 domain-containing protein [Rhodospirillaceae bacterium]